MHATRGLSIFRWFIAAVVLTLAPAVHAQSEEVLMNVGPSETGLGGIVRPGTWAPMQVQITSPTNREVACQWLLSDSDGDQVIAQRRVALTAGLLQPVWLYANPPANTPMQPQWKVRVLEWENQRPGRLLAMRLVSPRVIMNAGEAAVGVTDTAAMGLEPYKSNETQHEAIHLVTGLRARDLPDRWYGLSLLQALIWTRRSDPADRDVPHAAIREWVQRGGHLVIVTPPDGSVFDQWKLSPLADMLPEVQMTPMRDMAVPGWMIDMRIGAVLARTTDPRTLRIDYCAFEPQTPTTRAVSVLLRDEAERALVVASQYGLGRVTVIGVDLTDLTLARGKLPDGPRLWGTVMGWQSPAFSVAQINALVKVEKFAPQQTRDPVELGKFIEPIFMSMSESAAPAVLAAVLVFVMYWIVAGPVGYGVLKSRGLTRHSWVAFVGVVLAFSVFTWGGALLLRPSREKVSHFSVIDMDGHTNLRHVHSWLSVFLPVHRNVEFALGPGAGADAGAASIGGGWADTLSSPGMKSAGVGGFLNPQQYLLNVLDTGRLTAPIRATTKQFEADCLLKGGLDPRDPWPIPQGKLTVQGGWPNGVLGHSLPGTLQNVVVVYCRGDGTVPWAWRHPQRDWAPGQKLLIAAPTSAAPLVRVPMDLTVQRVYAEEGFLGRLMSLKTGEAGTSTDMSNNEVQMAEMLSFYSMLPPPDFTDRNYLHFIPNYDRSVGRPMDISSLAGLRCVIIIGHIKNPPLPVPLTVDGQVLPHQDSWAVVRWIAPLD